MIQQPVHSPPVEARWLFWIPAYCFTAGRLAGFKCPSEKAQAFLWDATAKGLGLRDTPAGAMAQVMGHKPSATAEGYRPRSVDALRPYLAQIEAHILQQAGVTFEAKSAPGALRVVAS